MQPQPISRRGFLLLAGVAGLLAGCGTEQTVASTPTETPAVLTSTPVPAVGDPSHQICYAGTVSPAILSLRVDAGQMIYARQVPYVPEERDRIDQDRGERRRDR